MEPSLQRSIAARAEQQRSLITDDQLHEIGVTLRRTRRLVSNGQLIPMGARTYRTAGAAMSFETRVMAACLDLGGVASHRTAAHLCQLAGFMQKPPTVEVTVPIGRGRTRSSLAIVHRTSNLGRDDVVETDGIPTTNVPRTILGLSALVPMVGLEDVRDAVDTAVRDGLATDAWLWWRLEQLRCRGRNGVAVLEEILQHRALVGPTESWLERQFLRLCDEAGLPRPSVQRRVAAKGAFAARIDCTYDRHLIAIELNGHGSHSTKRQRDADAVRMNQLQLLGYRVLQFTYDDVVRRPEAVAATIAEALARTPAMA